MPCFFHFLMHSTLLLFRFHGEVLGSDFENESHIFFFLNTVGQVNSSEFYYFWCVYVIQNLVFHLPSSHPPAIHSRGIYWVFIVI